MDWWLHEAEGLAEGYRCIAGIDEAGRGALAGPVVAACIVLPHGVMPDGVNDSKLVLPAERERLFDLIIACARAFAIGVAAVEEVDTLNVLRATHEAMRRAVAALPCSVRPDLALIDGLPVRPFPVASHSIVAGDGCCASIAAASILAKVTRDRIMTELDASFPEYGFARHKGYTVPSHLTALRECGPCNIHRRSFAPVREALGLPIEPTEDVGDLCRAPLAKEGARARSGKSSPARSRRLTDGRATAKRSGSPGRTQGGQPGAAGGAIGDPEE